MNKVKYLLRFQMVSFSISNYSIKLQMNGVRKAKTIFHLIHPVLSYVGLQFIINYHRYKLSRYETMFFFWGNTEKKIRLTFSLHAIEIKFKAFS